MKNGHSYPHSIYFILQRIDRSTPAVYSRSEEEINMLKTLCFVGQNDQFENLMLLLNSNFDILEYKIWLVIL